MPKILLSFCAVLWLIPLAQAQSAFTLAQVFAKMDEVAKTFHSVQADLEKTHFTVIVNDKDVVTGKFFYERRGKEPRVKMDIIKPAQHLLIDKGLFQLYNPGVNQVTQGSLSGHQDKVEGFMSLGFGQTSQELKQNFDVTLVGDETVDGRKTTVLELRPKSPSNFRSFKLWIDQQTWISYQTQATETSKDYSLFKFSNAKLNGAIPASTFDLKLPKNVNVLK
jgi:outer membrane lipoprotein-sorting protein